MFDSDEEESNSSSSSSDESADGDESTPPPSKKRKQSPIQKSRKPEMKVISSTARTHPAAGSSNDSFQSLLALQTERQSASQKSDARPNGNMQTSWKASISNSKHKKPDIVADGRQAKADRRSASKNVFRRIGK
jgi:hypothetical protein